MANSLGTWFRRQSVARKLTTSVVTTTAVMLLAASAVFVAYDYVTLRSRLVRDVTMLADILGTNSTAALTFAASFRSVASWFFKPNRRKPNTIASLPKAASCMYVLAFSNLVRSP